MQPKYFPDYFWRFPRFDHTKRTGVRRDTPHGTLKMRFWGMEICLTKKKKNGEIYIVGNREIRCWVPQRSGKRRMTEKSSKQHQILSKGWAEEAICIYVYHCIMCNFSWIPVSILNYQGMGGWSLIPTGRPGINLALIIQHRHNVVHGTLAVMGMVPAWEVPRRGWWCLSPDFRGEKEKLKQPLRKGT